MVDMKKKATDILEDYSNSYSQVDLETLTKFLEQIKAEAIKEFAKRANAKLSCYVEQCGEFVPYGMADIINNVAKEITEDEWK